MAAGRRDQADGAVGVMSLRPSTGVLEPMQQDTLTTTIRD